MSHNACYQKATIWSTYCLADGLFTEAPTPNAALSHHCTVLISNCLTYSTNYQYAKVKSISPQGDCAADLRGGINSSQPSVHIVPNSDLSRVFNRCTVHCISIHIVDNRDCIVFLFKSVQGVGSRAYRSPKVSTVEDFWSFFVFAVHD